MSYLLGLGDSHSTWYIWRGSKGGRFKFEKIGFYLSLIRLRAAGGLSEPVDQENVENYSKSGPTQASSGYTSGIGKFSGGEVERFSYFSD